MDNLRLIIAYPVWRFAVLISVWKPPVKGLTVRGLLLYFSRSIRAENGRKALREGPKKLAEVSAAVLDD